MLRKKRQGSVAPEIAIGVALAAIMVIVVLGMFGDNLSQMVTSSNINNMFKADSSKTAFSSFSRDYKSSQINVQIMGEQGLEMLRRKANNKAVELIASPFSIANPYSSTIAYLAKAVEIITGEPHICLYMEKDSEKHCDEDDIGGYNYNINQANTSITIQEVDTTGKVVKETVILALNSNVASILSSINIPKNSDGYSTLPSNEKYKIIGKMSKDVLSYLTRKDALLMSVNNTRFVSSKKVANSSDATDNNKDTTIQDVEMGSILEPINILLSSLYDSLKDAHDNCTARFFGADLNYSRGGTGCSGALKHGLTKGSNIGFVNKEELSSFKSLSDSLYNKLSVTSGTNENLMDLILESTYLESMLVILRNDHKNSPTSCAIFKSSLESIEKDYGLTIDIPACTPNDT